MREIAIIFLWRQVKSFMTCSEGHREVAEWINKSLTVPFHKINLCNSNDQFRSKLFHYTSAKAKSRNLVVMNKHTDIYENIPNIHHVFHKMINRVGGEDYCTVLTSQGKFSSNALIRKFMWNAKIYFMNFLIRVRREWLNLEIFKVKNLI